MIDTSHIPGIHAGSFMIPGGNGLPDLEVLTTDPAGWVTMQIAARKPAVDSVNDPKKSGVDPQGNILPGGATTPGTSLTEWLAGTGLKDTLQGLVVAGGMILLAVLLIILGAYMLSKD